MEFVESIQAEGVELERKATGEGTKPKTPLVIEVDNENDKKDMDIGLRTRITNTSAGRSFSSTGCRSIAPR
jgi:hypothetical protein